LSNSSSIFDCADEKKIVEDFDRDGFYLHRGLFSKQSISKGVTWLKTQDPKTLIKSWTDQEPAVPLSVYGEVHQDKNPVSHIANDPRIIEMAGKLIHKKTYIRASKVNLKAPWCGTVEYYHQDLIYWKDRGYVKNEMLSCMVLLQKHDIHNAALHVFPGTHNLGLIPHQSFININGLAKRMVPPEKLDELNKKHGLVVIEAKPGDALFFHAGLVHGSSHNISPYGRMALFVQIYTIENKPKETFSNVKRFNITRAKEEVEEASRRLQFFKEKLERQINSDDPKFCPPIPDQEK
jgi:ectoine hydroxylase